MHHCRPFTTQPTSIRISLRSPSTVTIRGCAQKVCPDSELSGCNSLRSRLPAPGIESPSPRRSTSFLRCAPRGKQRKGLLLCKLVLLPGCSWSAEIVRVLNCACTALEVRSILQQEKKACLDSRPLALCGFSMEKMWPT
ncbi:hypothetical protein DUNSADRAFT_14114 [Dunaliella salina]|uniref:Encoded protein n=1 Tax=Dunaliella salina TaxID=3046 RepID=A0ABQ7G7Z5_DUNSA|nr:hypothetical protein DUNSADRAFT_14114 [Dunaliella salina]|eukprot:KAF5830732.1 hypothetical protein DUNSADRAFT_14114 [Dunaliella salina]